MAVSREMDAILCGEVKWSEKPVGLDILQALRQKALKIRWGTRERREFFCLFSRKGFTASVLEEARKEGIALFQEDRRVC